MNEELLGDKKAVVYTQPGCQPCRAVLRWLDKTGAPVYTVSLTEALRTRFRTDGHLQAPIVELWENTEYGWQIEEVFSGFRPEKLRAFFG